MMPRSLRCGPLKVRASSRVDTSVRFGVSTHVQNSGAGRQVFGGGIVWEEQFTW